MSRYFLIQTHYNQLCIIFSKKCLLDLFCMTLGFIDQFSRLRIEYICLMITRAQHYILVRHTTPLTTNALQIRRYLQILNTLILITATLLIRWRSSDCVELALTISALSHEPRRVSLREITMPYLIFVPLDRHCTFLR